MLSPCCPVYRDVLCVLYSYFHAVYVLCVSVLTALNEPSLRSCDATALRVFAESLSSITHGNQALCARALLGALPDALTASGKQSSQNYNFEVGRLPTAAKSVNPS